MTKYNQFWEQIKQIIYNIKKLPLKLVGYIFPMNAYTTHTSTFLIIYRQKRIKGRKNNWMAIILEIYLVNYGGGIISIFSMVE